MIESNNRYIAVLFKGISFENFLKKTFKKDISTKALINLFIANFLIYTIACNCIKYFFWIF